MLAWLVRYQERLVAVVAATAWASPLIAQAQSLTTVNKPQGVPTGFSTLDKTITSIFNIVITVAGVAFVVLFLLGGIQYLGGAGNDESTKKARQLMLDAIVGLAIVVVAWAVGTYVLSILGIATSGGGLDTTPVRQ